MIKAARQKIHEEKKSTQQARLKPDAPAKEHGGPKGKEPTRYGDWEINGRCIDF